MKCLLFHIRHSESLHSTQSKVVDVGSPPWCWDNSEKQKIWDPKFSDGFVDTPVKSGFLCHESGDIHCGKGTERAQGTGHLEKAGKNTTEDEQAGVGSPRVPLAMVRGPPLTPIFLKLSHDSLLGSCLQLIFLSFFNHWNKIFSNYSSLFSFLILWHLTNTSLKILFKSWLALCI